MNIESVCFSGNRLRIGSTDLTLEHQILDAVQVEGTLVVLYEPKSYYAAKSPDSANLIAITADGRKLWTAELRQGDFYYRIKAQRPLLAYAPSYRYEIDLDTGKILSEEFVK